MESGWQYRPEAPAGLATVQRSEAVQQQGRRDASRFAAAPQVALASPRSGLAVLTGALQVLKINTLEYNTINF